MKVDQTIKDGFSLNEAKEVVVARLGEAARLTEAARLREVAAGLNVANECGGLNVVMVKEGHGLNVAKKTIIFWLQPKDR